MMMVWLIFGTVSANAGLLRISPTMIDIAAPGATATLTLRSEDAAPVQIRTFRWFHKNGANDLEPTEALVASPP
jgi:fimbrial chaperone protein